jgi:uncharacterized protein with PIN domain
MDCRSDCRHVCYHRDRLSETDAAQFGERLHHAESCAVSAASFVEAGIVAARRHGPRALDIVRRVVRELRLEVSPVTEEQAD